MSSLQNTVRGLFPDRLRQFYRNLKLVFTADMEFTLRRQEYDEKNIRGIAKMHLLEQFPQIAAPETAQAEINKHECKIYSQYQEDGILLYLFQLLGVTNRRFVEFGVSDGRESCTANLALNFGWSGLLIEGSPRIFKRAKQFYASLLTGPAAQRVNIINTMVTAENINNLLQQNNVIGEIDLLSVDIDSNDYWVWKAISAIQPRVVVVEYNGIFGKDKPITIPYQPNFDRFKKHAGGYYYGTSLPAIVKLGETKGYVFVGCESTGGVNAFFVRKDIAAGKISAVTVEQGFVPQMRRAGSKTQEQIFAEIAHLPFETV